MGYKRNKDPNFWNEEHVNCNCGSFALNVTSWVTPYDNDEYYTDEYRLEFIDELLNEGYNRHEIMHELLDLDSQSLLSNFLWLEPISLEEALPTDRVVAYRIHLDEGSLIDGEIDDDFHFRVRINGFWFEKCGCCGVQFCGTEADEKPWHTARYLNYDSEIRYFRFR